MPRHNFTINYFSKTFVLLCLCGLFVPQFANEEPKLKILNQKNAVNQEKLQLSLAARQIRQIRQPATALKMQSHLEILLENIDGYEPNSPVTVRAQITSSRDIDQLEYTWEGSTSLNIVKGLTSGFLQNLKAGESQEVLLSLQSPSSDSSLRLFFNASHLEASAKFGQSSQILLSKELKNASSTKNKLLLKSKGEIPAGLKVIY